VDLPAACELTQTRRLMVSGCRRWSGCSGCMRPRFSADGGAVNGIHSSRFNCYRIPARCLVTVLPPWVHAARRWIWPFDHVPGASDARNGCGMSSQCLFFFDKWLFPQELIDLLCWCRDLCCMSTRMVEQGNNNVQGCQHWHACIQTDP